MALTCTNVTLRQRVISNGRISLYLDQYWSSRGQQPHKNLMAMAEQTAWVIIWYH